MTSPLRDFVDRAFETSSELAQVSLGPFVARVYADDRSRPQGFERALILAVAPANLAIAVVAGADPVFDRAVPVAQDETHIVSDSDLYAHWQPAPDPILTVYDGVSRRGVMWFPEGQAPHWAIGQPFVPITHAVTSKTGWCVAHAAAVGRDGRFILLAGPGKAGKSTAALACARAGWDYAGDDLVLLNPEQRQVAPLFSSARIRQTGRAEFSELVDQATFAVTDDDGAERYELRLPFTPKGGRIEAILLVQRTGASPFVFRPARGAETVNALLRHSIARSPGLADGITRKLLLAAKVAPAFVVDTGTDPGAIPAAFERLLAEL